ncbi:50S ribosomal protein L31 [Idiomarina loihiensis]|uniref:Large ribosomal subunit protein bL31 n=4 Tax=Idiomarina TaxID=135575 RepID=RL31_IDILO|nr:MULTISPECIES: 50S ribosomal protein L31 [Idiomarina]Q5QV44.1 RecName: Full=Large ribosomal subunit protein bL31; AltName: Full=50S ribosomal protein L31 [Idiomarina loihiensis L2TR]NWO03825.1 50S ribosomal protein L31 [Idiomarinaceae bacterium]AAV83294.1 Ribosomal protein L31 [Idiomarina loihiensis L2TR]AGM37337.1 50S ribosomal protein L31 [Idiomarina loihiensis GSL 199]MBL4856095.1 50S ribosomal protein L31 [Idiomarina sp.]MCP1338954.1 50S ribosomal protein L31 [Idiomarina rhizosphaerae]
MKQGIHPKYETLKVSCSCGHTFETRSTRSEDLHLDVCSECHPFYTGKQRVMDTGGRVDKFKKRFGALGKKDS